MGLIIEAIIDWFMIGIVEKFAKRLPLWGCITMSILVVGTIAALLWWIGR